MKKKNALTVIIAAGGSGVRFGAAVPKQFAMLGGRPVLWHTLKAFYNFEPGALMVVSMHADSIGYWNQLMAKFPDTPPHEVIPGGKTRFHSVKNALAVCPDQGLILVHDAVRPHVSSELINRIVRAANKTGAVIPVTEVTDTLRRISRSGTEVVNRNEYVRVQTPQGFHATTLKQAYRQRFHKSFTDDASVVEKAGFPVSFVEGEESNIKITKQEDLR